LLTFEATAIGEEEEDVDDVVVFRRLCFVVAEAELSDTTALSLIFLCNVISFKVVDAVAASVDTSRAGWCCRWFSDCGELWWSLLMSSFLLRAAVAAVVVGLSLTKDPINKEWNAAVVVVVVGAAGMATTGKARALPRMMESPAAANSTDRKDVHGCGVMFINIDVVVAFVDGWHFPLSLARSAVAAVAPAGGKEGREERIHQFNLT
jgi:hypothetical protein